MCTKEICQTLIDTHKDRMKSKGESFLTPAQRDIYQAIADLVRTKESSRLRYRDIKSKYKGGLLPSDFCYDLVNKGPDFEVKFLRYRDRGIYEFVGFNWETADDVNIRWTPKSSDEFKNRTFTVGHYRKNRYEWDFNALTEFL